MSLSSYMLWMDQKFLVYIEVFCVYTVHISITSMWWLVLLYMQHSLDLFLQLCQCCGFKTFIFGYKSGSYIVGHYRSRSRSRSYLVGHFGSGSGPYWSGNYGSGSRSWRVNLCRKWCLYHCIFLPRGLILNDHFGSRSRFKYSTSVFSMWLALKFYFIYSFLLHLYHLYLV